MKKREFLALSGAAPLVLAGCGSSSSGSAKVRLVNVSVGYPKLDLATAPSSTDTSTTAVTGVAYGAASDYVSLSASSQLTILVDSTGSTPVNVSSKTRTLLKDTTYTLVGYGYKDAAKSILITENQTAPTKGYASISVLNTASDVGPVDVYFTQTTDISTASPVATLVRAVSSSIFNTVAAGTYVVTVVAYGTGASGNPDIRLQFSGVVVTDQQIATLVLAPGDGGFLAHAVLINQGGTTTNYRNTQARIRAIAATGNGGAVTVAGVLGATPSPGFSNYLQITAGAVPVIKVDGTTVAFAGTLLAGADYTLLVYGDKANPQVNLITDNNRLPSTSTAVKVRLLNAVFHNSAALTLKVNSVAVASSVSYGTASAYSETTAQSASNVEVKAGFVTVIPSTTTQNLVAGSIYTMVLAGDETATANYGSVVYDFSAAR